MARKRMKSKIQPAVLNMFFNVPAMDNTNDGYHYIDLSQCASILNRRFYRQGLNWAVSGFKLVMAPSSGGGSSFHIDTLPHTWVMSNAWEKSFRAWQKMIDNATDESGSSSVKPKFLDFKIFADKKHHEKGFSDNLLPFYASDTAVLTATAGEWVPAHVELAGNTHNFTAYDLIAVGPNDPGVGATGNDAKSIIQGYADSRSLPSAFNDPNVPRDAPENWMVELFGSGTDQDEEVIAELISSNNIAPYPFENDGTNVDTMYPGGETQLAGMQPHSIIQLAQSTTEQTQILEKTVSGTTVPCGLLRILSTSEYATVLQIQLVPGSHRGYLCEPMTEM